MNICKRIALLSTMVSMYPLCAMELDLESPAGFADNGLYLRRGTAEEFIDHVRKHRHKAVPNKYYKMIPQEPDCKTIYDAWSPNGKLLALLQFVHKCGGNRPLKGTLLTVINTRDDTIMFNQHCGKRPYEEIAISPRAHVFAAIYQSKKGDKKLLIRNLENKHEQKSHVHKHYVMPNFSQFPTIAFDKIGSRVVIVERLHKVETYIEGSTQEYGAKEDWKQSYQIVPVTVAHGVEPESD